MASMLPTADEDTHAEEAVVFTRTNDFWEVVNNVDGDWQAFSGVNQSAFDAICRQREARQRRIRFHYFPDSQLLFVTIPTAYHERAHRQIEIQLCRKMGPQADSAWMASGSTTFRGHGNITSSKEGDSGGYPNDRPDGSGWPTLVIEVGASQSLSSLRQAMRWWFSASDHRVKIVLLVKLYINRRIIQIEKYTESLVSGRPGATTTRSIGNGALTPVLRQTITIEEIVNGNSIAYNVTRGALVLEFSLLFLRQPVAAAQECDFVFPVEQLQTIAEKIWWEPYW